MKTLFLLLITSAYFSFIGCMSNKDFEKAAVRSVFSSVAQRLQELGFETDLSKVDIEVKTHLELEQEFAVLYKESTNSEKFYPAFAPKKKNQKNQGRMAFYDPNSKKIIIKSDSLSELTEGYVAHELVHVYQDQAFGFANLWKDYQDSQTRESFNIANYLIEGHAELARQAYEQKFSKYSSTKKKLAGELSDVVNSQCMFCHEKITAATLPYKVGLRFMAHLYKQGGWKLVEQALKNPPSSSEQILHPHKYKKDLPVIVDLPIWHSNPFNAYLVTSTTMGEAHLFNKILAMSNTSEAFNHASGWDGDTFHAYEAPGGKKIVVWRIAFDRDEDAKKLEMFLNSKNVEGARNRFGNILDWIITDDRKIEKSLLNFLAQKPFFKEKNLADMKTTQKQEEQSRKDAKFLNGNMYFFDYVKVKGK